MKLPFRQSAIIPGVSLHFAHQEQLDKWLEQQVFLRSSWLVRTAIEGADVVKVAALAEFLDRSMNVEVSDAGVKTNPDLAAAKKALVAFFKVKEK